MADILPRDLAPVPGGTVLPGTVLIIDDGAGVYKASVEQVAATGTPLASSAEVIAGSAVQKYLNPERTVEAINTHSPVRSVNGQTGVVVLAKGDVGLGNAANLAPIDYPVSTLQQAAINGAISDLSDDLASINGATMIGTSNGQTVQERLEAVNNIPFSIGTYVNPPLDNDEMIFTYTFTENITFPADYVGSQAAIIAMPTAATTVILLRLPAGEDIIDTVPAGTITFNTDGSVVFLSEMNIPISFAVGDSLIAMGPLTADATAAYSFTLIGAR